MERLAIDTDNPMPQLSGGQFLSFVLGEESYGIEILRVHEIRGYTNVTSIPNTPAHIKGVINLRGAVVPIVDLRAKFGMPGVAYTRFTVIVIVSARDRTVGLVVDAVSDVLNFGDTDIQPPPGLGASVDTRFLRGLGLSGDRLVALLDLDELLGHDVAALQGCMN